MDELCRENEFNYFVKNGDCPETNPMASFFILLSIIPMSVLFAMVVISQHMQITGNLEVEEEEDEDEKELYEEKYPLKKKNNTNKEPNTELLSVMEYTPNGNVFMKYNLDNEGFDYWSDYKEIPFNYLETVARKYVNMFNCSDLYLREEEGEDEKDSEGEYSSDFEDEETEENTEEDKNSKEVKPKPPEETKSPQDSDDEIFAKFKTTEKIKETIEEEGKIVNKFRYKGKLVDILVFKQKIKKKQEPKNISFSSWSVF